MSLILVAVEDRGEAGTMVDASPAPLSPPKLGGNSGRAGATKRRIMAWAIGAACCLAPLGAEAHALDGKTCVIQFGRADNPNQDAIGAFVLRFPAGTSSSPIVRKMGAEARATPWDGRSAQPPGYADVGTATLSPNDPYRVEMNWLGKARSLQVNAPVAGQGSTIEQAGSAVKVPATTSCH